MANVDDAEVAGIASDPDSRYVIRVDSYSDLKDITEKIISVTCGNSVSHPLKYDYRCVEPDALVRAYTYT